MPGGSRRQAGLEPRDCVVCGTRFQPYREFHVCCGSRSCRAAARDANPRRAQVSLECKDCGREFTAEWSGIGKKPPCPECAAEKSKARQDRKNVARRVATAVDPAKRRYINLRNNLSRYGVTPEQYAEMVERQGNCCAICGDSPDPNGIKAASRLHVDHDHTTGVVRELLCGPCNQGIGGLREDPALFRAAAEYIERHRAS